MHKVINIALLIPACIALAIFSGFVFTELWGWFIVPLGAPALSIAHGLGFMAVFVYPLSAIAMNIGIIKNKVSSEEKKPFVDAWSSWAVLLFVALFAWGYGAILSLLIG